MNEVFEKYSDGIIKNFDRNNFLKIVSFLKNNNCTFIDDIIDDYLDLFVIEYRLFVKKYEQLNKKHNGNFLEEASEDMNLLEEFYLN